MGSEMCIRDRCLIASGLALAQCTKVYPGAAGLARLHYGGYSMVRGRLRQPHQSAPKSARTTTTTTTTTTPTVASAADADRAALHTTASGVPNEHVSRLRQWFCSCASTTITPAAERINWYGKQTTCCIGSTDRLQHAPARDLTLVTMEDDNCSFFFDELGRCNGLSCSHDVSNWSSCTRMLRSRPDIENNDKQLVQLVVLSRCFQRCPA